MATTTADDVGVAGTDYRYQGMTDTFISENTKQRNASVQLGIDVAGALAASFNRTSLEGERFSAIMSVASGTMVGTMIGNLQAIGTDLATALVKMGLNLSNSASAPVPAYQNLGTAGPGQGLALNLPSKSTVTTA